MIYLISSIIVYLVGVGIVWVIMCNKLNVEVSWEVPDTAGIILVFSSMFWPITLTILLGLYLGEKIVLINKHSNKEIIKCL